MGGFHEISAAELFEHSTAVEKGRSVRPPRSKSKRSGGEATVANDRPEEEIFL